MTERTPEAMMIVALILTLTACASPPRSDGITRDEALAIIALDKEFRK